MCACFLFLLENALFLHLGADHVLFWQWLYIIAQGKFPDADKSKAQLQVPSPLRISHDIAGRDSLVHRKNSEEAESTHTGFSMQKANCSSGTRMRSALIGRSADYYYSFLHPHSPSDQMWIYLKRRLHKYSTCCLNIRTLTCPELSSPKLIFFLIWLRVNN